MCLRQTQVEYTLKPKDVDIKVEGVGQIQFPLSTYIIQQLIDTSTDAKFGIGEKTLLDTKVRNTKEISASKLDVKYSNEAFDTMLQEIRNKLGLSERSKLIPHLHNMLIYGPGQFFKAHQDTEKLPGMVASLVMVVPSSHIGGDLIIHHNDRQHKFTSENLNLQDIRNVAFYADCQHEIKKVKEGYRVVLTYNLVLEPTGSLSQSQGHDKEHDDIDLNMNVPFENALKEYFGLDQAVDNTLDRIRVEQASLEAGLQTGPEELEGNVARAPLKLVYFLDHSYTEHSLRWDMLKGSDHKNVLAFLNCSKKLGLIVRLALAEVHQSWTAEGYKDDPMPGDLIDDSTILSYWLDENNQKLLYRDYSINGDEICWTKDTEEFEPSESEYEGYMGNYGETIDYWYRRAAVVLWSEDDNIAMNFDLDYNTAIESLLKLTKNPGNEKQVLDIIHKADKYLYRAKFLFQSSTGAKVYSDEKRFELLSQLASYVKNGEVAEYILADFTPTVIGSDNVQILVRLQKLYGAQWCLNLMTEWRDKQQKESGSEFGFGCVPNQDIDLLLKHLLEAGVNAWLVEFLWQYHLDALIRCDKYYEKSKPIVLQESTGKRVNLAKGLLLGAGMLPDDNFLKKMVDYLISNATLYPALDLAEMMVALMEPVTREYEAKAIAIYEKLKQYVMNAIKNELDMPRREEGDWSINLKLSCSCEKCRVAEEFLRSKIEVKKIWPIAKEYRNHIKEVLRGFGLPLNVSELAQGSPHKLVIVKTNKLYLDAKTRFKRLKICHEKLQMM